MLKKVFWNVFFVIIVYTIVWSFYQWDEFIALCSQIPKIAKEHQDTIKIVLLSLSWYPLMKFWRYLRRYSRIAHILLSFLDRRFIRILFKNPVTKVIHLDKVGETKVQSLKKTIKGWARRADERFEKGQKPSASIPMDILSIVVLGSNVLMLFIRGNITAIPAYELKILYYTLTVSLLIFLILQSQVRKVLGIVGLVVFVLGFYVFVEHARYAHVDQLKNWLNSDNFMLFGYSFGFVIINYYIIQPFDVYKVVLQLRKMYVTKSSRGITPWYYVIHFSFSAVMIFTTMETAWMVILFLKCLGDIMMLVTIFFIYPDKRHKGYSLFMAQKSFSIGEGFFIGQIKLII